MSFRTDYLNTLSSALITARNAGSALIAAQSVALTASLQASANKGVTSFTITYDVSFQPVDIKLGGKLWEAYKTGMMSKLIEVTNGDLMVNEFTVSLNLTDQSVVRVDILFSF